MSVASCSAKPQGNVAADARIKELENELNGLEAAVIQSEDVSAVKRLMRTYGYYVDGGLWEDLSDLFTADGVANYPSGVFIGKDSIHKHYLENLGAGKLGRSDGDLAEYMILQPIVDIEPDGKTAHGRWRALAMLGTYGKSATWAEGPYEVQYAKDNGVWKIKTLNYYGTFTSPYENGGWGVKRDNTGPAPRKPAHAPDKPRDNAVCPQYPQPCVAPFHYKNPVSGRNPKDES
ncbi:MAG: nuclear transport factor 2 family protein [Pseudomonadota bacterium]